MEDQIQKKYYSIGEVAKMMHQRPPTIRFWESSFPWIDPRRNKKGKRRYTLKVIGKIRTVAILLKVGGMTIDGVTKAHKMGYLEDLEMYFIKEQRRFRPEGCDLLDFENNPYLNPFDK